jgi:hypothetical protein
MKKFALVLAAALLSSNVAFALDLTQQVKTYDGQDFVGPDGKPTSLTYLSVIENALLTEQPSSPASAVDDRSSNDKLARRIHEQAKDFTFSLDETIKVRKALAATQVTAVFGQVMAYIDPTYLPKK